MKKQTVYLILTLLLIAVNSLGQNQENTISYISNSQTDFALRRTIKLEKDSKPKQVTVFIKQKTKRLELNISSAVRKGKVKIELYNPKGILKGNFTVGTQLDSNQNEIVQGNIKKSLKEPLSGNWKIKIIPVVATGDIMIKSVTTE